MSSAQRLFRLGQSVSIVPYTAVKKANRPYLPRWLRNAHIRLAKTTLPASEFAMRISGFDTEITAEARAFLKNIIENYFIDRDLKLSDIAPFYSIRLQKSCMFNGTRIRVFEAVPTGRLIQLDQPVIYPDNRVSTKQPILTADTVKEMLIRITTDLFDNEYVGKYEELSIFYGLDLIFSSQSKLHASGDLNSSCWGAAHPKLSDFLLYISSNSSYSSLVHELIHFLQAKVDITRNFFREGIADFLGVYYSGDIENAEITHARALQDYVFENKVTLMHAVDNLFKIATSNQLTFALDAFFMYACSYFFAKDFVQNYGIKKLWELSEEMSNTEKYLKFMNDEETSRSTGFTGARLKSSLIRILRKYIR